MRKVIFIIAILAWAQTTLKIAAQEDNEQMCEEKLAAIISVIDKALMDPAAESLVIVNNRMKGYLPIENCLWKSVKDMASKGKFFLQIDELENQNHNAIIFMADTREGGFGFRKDKHNPSNGQIVFPYVKAPK